MNRQLSEGERRLREEVEEARDDPRTEAELLREAVGDSDEDEEVAYRAVRILHLRATREVLGAVTPLCQSAVARKRSVAAWVLGQLGVSERAFPEECHALLASMLRRERDPAVLRSLATACGHLRHPGAVPLLLP